MSDNLYPGMDGLDDLLKEYNKEVENPKYNISSEYPDIGGLNQPLNYDGGFTNQSSTSVPQPGRDAPQNQNNGYSLQGSSSNYSTVDPYRRFMESNQNYDQSIQTVPQERTPLFQAPSSQDTSGIVSKPQPQKSIERTEESGDEISDTTHKANCARLDIFQYFNDSPSFETPTTEESTEFDELYDMHFPVESSYQFHQPRTTDPHQQNNSEFPAPSHHQNPTGGLRSLSSDLSSFVLNNQDQTQRTTNNPYSDITSNEKYKYFPRPRDQLPPKVEEEEEEQYEGSNLINEEEAKKRRMKRIKKQRERLIKRRLQKLKKFRLRPVKNIFGQPLEDAVIRPFDDPIDKNDEFTCSFLPFPLYRLLNHLETEKFLKTQGLYRKSGSVEKLQILKKAYNKGNDPDLSKFHVHTCGSLVKDYLKSLPDPLIPFSEHHSFMDSAVIQSERFRVEELRICVRQLPDVNRRVLKILVEHLRRVVDFKAENSMDSSNLGIVFAPTILKGDGESRLDILRGTPDRIKIVSHLISDYHRIFEN